MTYRVLADLVVLAHTLFVVFVVVGGFLVWRWRWLAWLHVPCAVWGMVSECKGWIWPLTPLATALRTRAGLQGYEGGWPPGRRRGSRRGLLARDPAGVHARPHAHQPQQRGREPVSPGRAGSDAALPRVLEHRARVHDVAGARAGDRGRAPPARRELRLRPGRDGDHAQRQRSARDRAAGAAARARRRGPHDESRLPADAHDLAPARAARRHRGEGDQLPGAAPLAGRSGGPDRARHHA